MVTVMIASPGEELGVAWAALFQDVGDTCIQGGSAEGAQNQTRTNIAIWTTHA